MCTSARLEIIVKCGCVSLATVRSYSSQPAYSLCELPMADTVLNDHMIPPLLLASCARRLPSFLECPHSQVNPPSTAFIPSVHYLHNVQTSQCLLCVILSLVARGEIMLHAKVCWGVGRGGFRSLSCCDDFRHRFLLLSKVFVNMKSDIVLSKSMYSIAIEVPIVSYCQRLRSSLMFVLRTPLDSNDGAFSKWMHLKSL
jgi:hypothetical protein